jgi:hypothetical protein
VAPTAIRLDDRHEFCVKLEVGYSNINLAETIKLKKKKWVCPTSFAMRGEES